MILTIIEPNKLNCVLMLVLASIFFGNVVTELNNTPKTEVQNNTQNVVLEQKSVKKELKINLANESVVEISPPPNVDNNNHNGTFTIIDEKSVRENAGKASEQQLQQNVPKGNETPEASTKISLIKPQQYQHPVDENIVLSNEDDISDSLKAGFYFFLILSSSAIVFIIFKIYRLRLSRAERKYGVQGDRTTQELTPLPISIEDGHSDDEDQTLFEVKRQNFRIL